MSDEKWRTPYILGVLAEVERQEREGTLHDGNAVKGRRFTGKRFKVHKRSEKQKAARRVAS